MEWLGLAVGGLIAAAAGIAAAEWALWRQEKLASRTLARALQAEVLHVRALLDTGQREGHRNTLGPINDAIDALLPLEHHVRLFGAFLSQLGTLDEEAITKAIDLYAGLDRLHARVRVFDQRDWQERGGQFASIADDAAQMREAADELLAHLTHRYGLAA